MDGKLILLLAGLFVVNAALTQTGLPQKIVHDLQSACLDFTNTSTLFPVASAWSKVVGNNPTVMLLAPFLPHSINPDALGAALASVRGFPTI